MEEGPREPIDCGVVRELNDVDIIFQRARERRERRERGLPGTLTGNEFVLKSLRGVGIKGKGKERVEIRNARFVFEGERNMLRLE